MLSLFSHASWPSVCLLWRNVYLVLSSHFLIKLFVFLLLSCMSCLYILEIKPLSVASFANIFSHSIGCLFILFMVSFAVQKLVSLIRSHLFIFAFISFALEDRSKKYCYNLCQRVFCLCFLLGVLWFRYIYILTFSSLSHFELIFVDGVRECSTFIV